MAIDIALDLLYAAVVLVIVWLIMRWAGGYLSEQVRASVESAFKSTVAIVCGMVVIKAIRRIASPRRS